MRDTEQSTYALFVLIDSRAADDETRVTRGTALPSRVASPARPLESRRALRTMDIASFVSNGSHGPVTLLEIHPQLAVAYVTVLGVAAFVGTAGNLLLLTTILLASRGSHGKPLHGVVFIVNLVCSDLIVTAVINPFAIIGECAFNSANSFVCKLGRYHVKT